MLGKLSITCPYLTSMLDPMMGGGAEGQRREWKEVGRGEGLFAQATMHATPLCKQSEARVMQCNKVPISASQYPHHSSLNIMLFRSAFTILAAVAGLVPGADASDEAKLRRLMVDSRFISIISYVD